MIYEVLKHIQEHGSVDAKKVEDILNNFTDLNQESVVKKLDDSEFVRYSTYGIEALKETVARSKKGKYD